MLLDTHVWLWTAEGDSRKVGPKARSAIERAWRRDHLFLCAVSAFELAALHVLQKVDLFPSADVWVRNSIATFGFKVIDVTTTAALNAGLIPTTALADPVDRLIVSAAAHVGVPLVTRDERILDYARVTRAVRAIDAAE